MKTIIIHESARLDRFPKGLVEAIPDAILMEPIIPRWEHPRNITNRGCSLSRLHAIRTLADPGQPILTLEDDATFTLDCPANWREDYQNLPPDCGAVLLGGDITKHRPSVDYPGWHEVLPPWFGAQAVIYNLPLLLKTDFLLNSYIYLASNQFGAMGYNGQPAAGLCGESLISLTTQEISLKIYAREEHVFTTVKSMVSYRTGKPEEKPRAFRLL